MSNKDHLENLLKNTMENLRSMIDVNTVVGDAIETRDGTYIIPVSRLSFGFASGGGEIPICDDAIHHHEHHDHEHNHDFDNDDNKFPFSGASGAGVSVKPVAFLVVNSEGFRMIPIDHDNTYDRIVDTIPQVLDMVKNFLKDINYKNKNKNNGNNDNVDSML